MASIHNKVILITGAGRGSGRLLSAALAETGAIVAANDISPVNVDEVVSGIVAGGGRASAYVEDVAKKVAAQHLVMQVEDDFGRIDILINHASVHPHIPLLEMDEWDWHRTLEVNLTGAFLMTQAVGCVMKAAGSGMIINLVTPLHTAAKGETAFATSMSGLEGLTHQAGRELGPHGIEVHAVEDDPGAVVEEVLMLLNG